jgi:hypothetical protein
VAREMDLPKILTNGKFWPIHLVVAACHREAIDEGRTSLYVRSGTFHGADLGGLPVAGGKIGLTTAEPIRVRACLAKPCYPAKMTDPNPGVRFSQ